MEDAKKAVYNGKADCMIMDSGKLEQYSDDNKLHSVFLESTVWCHLQSDVETACCCLS